MGDAAACQHHLDLTVGQTVAQLDLLLAHSGEDRGGVLQRAAQPGEAQDIVAGNPVRVRGVREFEGEDAEVREVLLVDAREGLRDDDAQPQVAGRDDRVFAGRALTVVLAAHDRMAAIRL